MKSIAFLLWGVCVTALLALAGCQGAGYQTETPSASGSAPVLTPEMERFDAGLRNADPGLFQGAPEDAPHAAR
ncbi:MAG: hypothetical protein ACHRHE_00265 [Tepidisphaerales bacterium]